MSYPHNCGIINKIKEKLMQLYGLNSCDSCRTARKALKNMNIEYVDVREAGVPKNILEAAFSQFGAALVNKSSTTWRALDNAARAGDPIDLLQAHPTLMKRPLIVNGAKMTLGWKPDVLASYAVLPKNSKT